MALGERSGAKVLVGTVVANLKDCPPFASQHRPGLTDAQRNEWEQRHRAAMELADSAHYLESLTNAQAAAKLDDRHAELHFQLGRCHWGLGHFNEAKKSFEEARDLDTLRFRADGRINQIIHQVTEGGPSRRRIEAVATMERNSPNGIPGEELLYEHVHPNFSGNYLLARAFAESILSDAANTSPLLSEADCAQRLACTDFDRYRVLDEVRQRLQQPPFTAQFDQEGRDRRIKRQLDKLDHASLTNALAIYEQAIARRPDDWVLRENLATLLQDFAEPREAELQWRKVIELLPHSDQGWFGLANLLDTYSHPAEAVTAFREALRRRPHAAEARNGLALALANEGRTVEAIAEFERTLRRNPGFVEARVNLGQTLAAQGRTAEAATQYLEVLRLRSNNVPAHVNLGKLLAAEGKLAEAIAHDREAIRLKPGNAVAHYNLGNALNTQGNVAAANAEFAEAVRLNPGLAEAHYNLALGLARLDQSAEALKHFSEAVRLNPNSAESRFNLGVALAREQRFAEAITEFRETLRLDPNNAMAKKFLEQAQARQRPAQ
jgi:tetratricopeptide (TPR) repeat protein